MNDTSDIRSGSHPFASPTFGGHLKATLVLGMPLVGAQLTQMLVNVTDTVMLGWLGTKELAAGTLAFQSFFTLLIFGIGFGAAMMPLIGNALGRDDPRAVRRAARMGLWSLVGMSVVFMLPLWFTKQVLLALGQDGELAQLAQDYMRIAQWSLIPAFVLIGLRSFLTSLEKANAVLVISVFAAIINAIFNYAFIFGNWGAPRLEMQGAGVATLLANSIAALAAIFYITRVKQAQPYKIFTRLWRPDWPALSTISKMGVPISLSIFAEAGMFIAGSIMIGWIGTVQLAAHGIALQVSSLTFMIPLGLSQAASVRVSNAVGRGDTEAIGTIGKAIVVLGLFFALVSALVFVVWPEFLIGLFLDADNSDASAVILYGVPLLYMAAAFQLFDTLQVAYAGNLRGLQDTKVPMIIAIVSYWMVGMVSAYVFAFVFGYGSVGVWAGLVAGLAVAGVALTHRFINRERLGLV